MIKSPMTHARSLMTCASMLALCAVAPGVASAQNVDTGGGGRALTTGTISTSAGNVTDGGANGPVNASGSSALVTVDNATIANTLANSQGLNISSTSGPGGSGISAVFTGVNSISGTAAAVMVSGIDESASIDTSTGGGTYAGGLNANSFSGSATILNGSNVITAAAGQFGLSATASGTGAVLVNSVGGTIAAGYGISASSQGGDVTVGQGGGVTTAISLGSPTGIGISATTSGAGNISVTTGAGGTIGGGQYGVYANNNGGSGAININVGAAIGGTTAPTGSAIDVASGLGPISIVSTASLSSQSTAIYATSTGGAISVAAGSTVTSTYGTGVYANSFGQAGTTGGGAVSVGSAGQRVSGVTAGSNGIFAAGAGDVSVYAGTVTGGTRGVLASSQSNGTSDGAVLIDVNGQVVAANSYGVLGINNGVLSANTLSITTAGVTSTNGSAISAQSAAGDITINAGGPLVANAGSNGGWDGIYAASIASGAANFNINITAANSVFGTLNGIEADGPTQGSITINAAGPVAGTQGAGVFASGGGDVSINTAAVTSGGGAAATRLANPSTGANDGEATNVAPGQGFGIAAISTGGNVAVTSTGLVTGGVAGGVLAQALGTGSISVSTAGVTAAAGMGIEADSNGGNVTVAAGGPVSGWTYGIYVANNTDASAGSVTVTTASTVTSTLDYGISVRNLGTGAVSVGTASQRLGGLVTGGSTGILAVGEGDVSVYAGAVTGGSRGIVASSQPGNGADTTNGAVVVDVNGPVIANGGYGIVAENFGSLAANSITINAGQVTATGGTAISALGGGDITVNATGPLVANALGGGGWDGVYVDGEGDSLIKLTTAGPVTGTWNGIEVYSNGTTARSGVNITAGGSVTAAAGQAAILATLAGQGDLNLTTAAGTTLTANGGIGISASTTTGALNITTASGSSIAPGAAVGIQAVSQSGAITINQGGDIGAAGANGTVGLGVDAEIQSASATSAININSTGGIYVAAGTGLQSSGIYAVNAGSGAINVTTNGVIDPGAYGVVLQGSGPVSFLATGGGVTGQIGVYAATTGAGGVSVASSAGSAIVGLAGAGVDAEGGAGGAVVNVRGSVTGATTGVIANSTGAGATVVTTGGAVVGGTTGLSLTAGAGGLNLTVNGNVTAAGGPAINATSAAGATININAGATVTGLVTGANQAVINLSTASGQSSTINVASGAVVAAASGSVSDVAIRATGGSVVVDNDGQINGTVDFSALTGANTGTLKNAPGTVFTTSGVSNFGTGNANFANSGTLQTQGSSTVFNFGGTNNVFNNTGTVVVGAPQPTAGPIHAVRMAGMAPAAAAGPSSFVLNNLTTFANSGALQMINGVVGDSIVMNGTAYVGSGAALLGVDTVIGAPGSASDVLIVGSSSGHTSVAVHDAAAASFGAYNPTGTVIVQGLTHPGDFTLAPSSSWYNPTLFGGALDKPGFFFSQLGVDPTSKNTVLISAPKLQAFQFATLPTQAQTIWYDTTPQPEHQGELRDQLAKSDGGPSQSAPSVWFKVEGATAQRDVSQSWSGAGNSYSYDAGYSQDVTSEMAGFDALSRTADGWGAAYGMSAGYVNSTTHFDQMQTRTQADGFTLNGYATVVRKDLFAQLTVGGDALRANLTAPLLTGYAAQTKDIASIGGSFEAGVRKPFLFGATIEPSFGLTYVQSSIGDLASAGSRFHFDDPQSLRLSLGVRLSGAAGRFDMGAWRTRYDVSLRAVDEVMGASGSTLSSAGPDLSLMDNLQKQFGEARIGLTSTNQNGWSATASVRERFSAAYTDTGLTLGLRYRF